MSELLNIEVTLQFIRDKAKEHAVALAEREHLKEFRKSQKALLINKAEQKGIKTAQARECYAYAHKDYISLLDGLKVAIERECELRHLIKSAELRCEIWRSQNARANSERNTYNSRGLT